MFFGVGGDVDKCWVRIKSFVIGFIRVKGWDGIFKFGIYGGF